MNWTHNRSDRITIIFKRGILCQRDGTVYCRHFGDPYCLHLQDEVPSQWLLFIPIIKLDRSMGDASFESINKDFRNVAITAYICTVSSPRNRFHSSTAPSWTHEIVNTYKPELWKR